MACKWLLLLLLLSTTLRHLNCASLQRFNQFKIWKMLVMIIYHVNKITCSATTGAKPIQSKFLIKVIGQSVFQWWNTELKWRMWFRSVVCSFLRWIICWKSIIIVNIQSFYFEFLHYLGVSNHIVINMGTMWFRNLLVPVRYQIIAGWEFVGSSSRRFIGNLFFVLPCLYYY